MEQLNTDTSNLNLAVAEDGTQATEYTPASKANGTIFEIRPSPGKGYGIFALRQIIRGTCVFSEKALMLLPINGRDQAKANIHEEFKKLNPEQLQEFGMLACTMEALDPGTDDQVRSRLIAEGRSGAELERATAEELRLRAIFHTNVVSTGFKDDFGSGIFPTFSRLNHSCTPNVEIDFKPKLGQQTVFATRDIDAGEELTTSYIGLLHCRDQRADALRKWTVDCDCNACKDLHESEPRRKRLFDINQLLAMYERNMLSSPDFPTATPPTNDGEALVLGQEMVQLLKDEGIVGIELASAYHKCGKYSLKTLRIGEAKAYETKVLEIETYCVGTERSHFGNRAAEAWLKYLNGQGAYPGEVNASHERAIKRAIAKQRPMQMSNEDLSEEAEPTLAPAITKAVKKARQRATKKQRKLEAEVEASKAGKA